MPFHTDHRPDSFKKFEGNKKTLDSLQSALRRKRPPHAFLFCGPSGCGKTTLARISAAELGCVGMDLVEINASNNRGIDTAREIAAQIGFLPAAGKAKVYIIDEVHQTTKDFQNAILKALEEPPSYVYFMLCTTEPDKLLTTIRNRCATFSVSYLPSRRIDRLLRRVVRAEGVGVSEKTILTISENAGGCPRRALIMLDQIIDIPDEDMAKILKSEDRTERQVIDLCRALNNCKPWSEIATILRAVDADSERMRHAVISYFNKILMDKDDAYAALIIECFSEPFWQLGGMPGLTLACYQTLMRVSSKKEDK